MAQSPDSRLTVQTALGTLFEVCEGVGPLTDVRARGDRQVPATSVVVEILYTTDVEMFEGALWVVGQRQDPVDDPDLVEPWIAHFAPETGALLEVSTRSCPRRRRGQPWPSARAWRS